MLLMEDDVETTFVALGTAPNTKGNAGRVMIVVRGGRVRLSGSRTAGEALVPLQGSRKEAAADATVNVEAQGHDA